MTRKFPSPAHRVSVLTALRDKKMAKSVHAYVRGSTVRFYEWLQEADRRLPAGPSIWICGDCHLSNIGPVADAEGRVDVQIRDLDQTVRGNPAHDLIRLGLSLAMAARGSDLPGMVTASIIEQIIVGYEQALSGKKGARRNTCKRPKTIQLVVKRATRRKWRHLAAERIEGVEPKIPLSKKYWPISSAERAALETLTASEEIRALTTFESSQGSCGRRNAGCGLLGERLQFARTEALRGVVARGSIGRSREQILPA
jgi:uncharacterized protein (DUF2252 family)